MNTLIIFLFVIAELTGIAFCQSCNVTEYEDGTYHAAVYGSQIFASQLYQEVSSMEGNLVLAPLSVAIVLALLRVGTTGYGITGRQLSDVLHLAQDNYLIAQGFRQLLEQRPISNDPSGNEASLLLENRMFVQSGYNIEETFEETAVNDFKSGIQQLNFTDDTENARETINQWVEDSTMERITDLIPDGSLTPDTRLVLVNAIYFRGAWREPFTSTIDDTFHISDSEEVTVPMMQGSFQGNYGVDENTDSISLRIPYLGPDFEAQMIIVLPNNINGLADLEKKLDIVQYTYEPRQVNAAIPPFKFESSFNLKESLMNMGVTEIFGSNADLCGISEDEGLYVDQILQKSFISVNENGTEASAATAVGVSPDIVYPSVDFKADHPFVFVIRDEDNIYFIGRVANPLQQ